MAIKEQGLYVELIDMERFISVNKLPEVTNPLVINKNQPTPDGILSYELFGTSNYDRRNRMAYIDLHGHYMQPLAAKKLAAYDRRLNKVLMALGQWKLVNGDLVEVEEGGDTGPEFLYSIWGKVKVKDKETVTTKELETFFRKKRDELFITKFLVIPAFYRDINQGTTGNTRGMHIVNNIYSSIISYIQSLEQYSDTFTSMANITRGRVQGLLNELYEEFMIRTVKGSPSKFGMLRRSMLGKNVNYSARLVISSPVLRKGSFEDVQVKFGYATLPLAYTLSCFFPFMVHGLKRFMDAEFVQGGKYPVSDGKGGVQYVTITGSYDENEITKMITRYINSPSTRYDKVVTPPDEMGRQWNMTITGRFGTENTTITRECTITELLYIVATDVVKDKHVFITRYPLDNYNGQFPARVEVASTTHTYPAVIGEKMYQFYPKCEGDPANAFVDTMQFSNPYLAMLGGDYDGDTVSVRPVFTKEANEECEQRIKSNAYVLNISGGLMRPSEKDFLLTAYNLTNDGDTTLTDINATQAKYAV